MISCCLLSGLTQQLGGGERGFQIIGAFSIGSKSLNLRKKAGVKFNDLSL